MKTMIPKSLSALPKWGSLRQHRVSLVLCLMLLHSVDAEQLSVSELLERYAANQSKLKSFVIKSELKETSITEDGTDSRSMIKSKIIEFRYEDDGGNFRAYYCPKDVHSGVDGSLVPADRQNRYLYLWDRKRYIEHYRTPTLDESNAFVSFSTKDMKDAITRGYFGAGSVLGFLYGDVERFDSILKQADSTSVRDELERVGSGDCYVIDAKTKHGTYTIWLDPEHGYGIAKAYVHRGPKDLRWGRPLDSYKFAPYDSDTFSIRNVRFESKEDIWVPMEADFRIDSKGPNSAETIDIHHWVTDLLLNPDHDTLGSFVPDIENGTSVRIEEAPGIRYVWQNGKIVADIDEYVIEEIDKMSEEIMAEGQASSGLEAKKTKAVPNDLIATANTQPKTQVDAIKTRPEVVAESGSLPIVLVILIGFLTIGIIGWLVFRRIKA